MRAKDLLQIECNVTFSHRPSRLPVVYIFGKKPIDVDDCINQLGQCLTTQLQQDDMTSNSNNRPSILLRYDVGYSYNAGDSSFFYGC